MSSEMAVPEDRLNYTRSEILADSDFKEPLIANGVRCHGGFTAEGLYQSPRTRFRAPAIEAWSQSLQAFGGNLIAISDDLLPPQYPNVEQARLLCRNGILEPIVRALTVISVVEGFGAIIRDVKVPDFSSTLVEPTQGTALAHLTEGLFEAHARDEAGWGEQGGHKQMWEAARDLAFDNPQIPPDVLMRIMGGDGRRRTRKRERKFPQIDADLEAMVNIMSNVLIVEVFAERVFEWGKAVLSDPEICVKPEEAAAMVGYIQSDETPHVNYLAVALSELAARTVRTEDGQTLSGRELVYGTIHGMLSQMIHQRPKEQRKQVREDFSALIAKVENPKQLQEEFESLERQWSPPATTGFELQARDGAS